MRISMWTRIVARVDDFIELFKTETIEQTAAVPDNKNYLLNREQLFLLQAELISRQRIPEVVPLQEKGYRTP